MYKIITPCNTRLHLVCSINRCGGLEFNLLRNTQSPITRGREKYSRYASYFSAIHRHHQVSKASVPNPANNHGTAWARERERDTVCIDRLQAISDIAVVEISFGVFAGQRGIKCGGIFAQYIVLGRQFKLFLGWSNRHTYLIEVIGKNSCHPQRASQVLLQKDCLGLKVLRKDLPIIRKRAVNKA